MEFVSSKTDVCIKLKYLTTSLRACRNADWVSSVFLSELNLSLLRMLFSLLTLISII